MQQAPIKSTIGITEKIPQNWQDNISLSCDKCGHVTVCCVIRKITAAFSDDFTEKTLPFSPEAVAKVCTQFVSRSTINALKTNEGS